MKNIGMEDMSVDIDVVTSDELISITDKMESCYEDIMTSLNNHRNIIIETLNKHLSSLNI